MAPIRTSSLTNVKTRENSILKNVYAWMSAGLALTAVVSYTVASSESLMRMFFSSAFSFMFVIIAQLALVIYLSARLEKMSAMSAVLSFAGYSILTGVSLSLIVLAYTPIVLSRAFFTTALLFGGMSFYGMVTKRNLDGIGHYLIMGLWGIIIASIINMIFQSSGLYYMVSYLGVFIFLGLTAWDTQKIKRMNDAYGSSMDEDTYIKLSIIGALMLYLDFINIFLFLLRIFGRSNR
ncbi:MAG: Bax inhibitor-1/YccA family protein [Sphaerochaetaceae bacterium]|nr:Bax inhibitor-1/YccA family protein [Sphaerochaetaceae bacterium]